MDTHGFQDNVKVQNFLLKQADIDKILKIIQWKVKRYTFTHYNKGLQAGYLVRCYFKDIFLYLAQNKLPSTKSSVRMIEALAEKYILLDSLLFKIISSPEKETAVLAILEVCTDKIITLYHQGVIQTYSTISYKFFIPNLIHYLRSYIKGCHICQPTCSKKLLTRYLQTRNNLNYRPLSRLSMDLKVMP